MHRHIQQIWSETKKTILFVTHSVGEAVRLADRVVVLSAHPGRVRRVFEVEAPRPRALDTAELAEIGRRVRIEIEDEVNRANAAMEAEE